MASTCSVATISIASQGQPIESAGPTSMVRHAGDLRPPPKAMTAISLGRFSRGLAIPTDFGSLFTTAPQGGNPDRCGAGASACQPISTQLSREGFLILQLETQRDVRLIELGNRTSGLGVMHCLLKRLFAGPGQIDDLNGNLANLNSTMQEHNLTMRDVNYNLGNLNYNLGN